MAAQNTRDIVLNILLDVQKGGTFSHTAIHDALDANPQLLKRDRAFITKICEGTLERLIEIDYILDLYSSIPVQTMKPVIQNILRSATYQILYLGGVPDATAVSEAVQLAQSRGFYNLKGFVNAVLRAVVRHRDVIPYPDIKKEPLKALSVRYSMPGWIVEEWIKDYGIYATEMILEGLLEERPTTVRLKRTRTEKKEILDSLRGQGVRVKHAAYLPYAYNISNYHYLPALDAFMRGWIYPQDVSSMLVAEVASPKQGDYIIDVCAAPGGKSLHVADMMEGFGMVEARDLSDEKVDLIRDNVRRADLINLRPRVMDALVYDSASEAKADIVLCDLPCSGLGVAGRKSDIKYRVTPESVDDLVELQRRILHNAASYVKEGGALIFSTCTISAAENIENVRWFLEHYPFRAGSLNPYLPRELWQLSTEKGYLQLLPGIHESDGFFLARFVREKG